MNPYRNDPDTCLPRPADEPQPLPDPDEIRRKMIETGQPQTDLTAEQGQTWTTSELTADFEVLGFAAPFVVVRRRSDGAKGSLEFTHSPRVYFGWRPDQ